MLYVEPKDSDNNLTSHFQEFLPDIIIQDNRKAPQILLNECKLVVNENAHLKRKRKDVTQTLLSFNFDMIVDCARSACFICSFACVNGVVYTTERGTVRTWRKITFEFGESSGKLGLQMTNRTHTDERKMV